MLIGDLDAIDARAHRRASGEPSASESYEFRPPAWIGTATESQLAFPYLDELGLPGEVPPQAGRDRPARCQGDRRLAGRRRGHRARRPARGPVRRGSCRRHPRLPHDEPGMGRAVHEDRRPRDQRRRPDRSSGRAEPRVRHPGGRRDAGRDGADHDRRPDPRRRHARAWSTSSKSPRSPATTSSPCRAAAGIDHGRDRGADRCAATERAQLHR